MKAKNTNPNIKCKNCKHTHIGTVGDLGINEDETGLDRLLMCSECDCENFKGGGVRV